MTPIGGDAPHRAKARAAQASAPALGAAIGAVVGAARRLDRFGRARHGACIPLGAGLGAYVGSFAGAMAKVRAGRRDDGHASSTRSSRAAAA